MHAAIDEVTAAVDQLMVLAGEYSRGQCIPWGVIESISGSRDENRGKHVIKKWRKRIQKELEIVTLSAPSVGVRLLTHKETATEIPAIRQSKAYRQIRKALKETSLVDDSKLGDHDRRLLACQRTNMADQRRELFRSQKQLATRKIATETNPRRKASA